MFAAASVPETFKVAEVASGKEWVVLAAELLGMTLFAFAVASAMRMGRNKVAAALTVGGGLFMGLMIAGVIATYLGTASMLNPAVAFAGQAFAFDWAHLWPSWCVWLLAPLVGGVLGFALNDLLYSENDNATV